MTLELNKIEAPMSLAEIAYESIKEFMNKVLRADETQIAFR